ncbi:transaminase [Capsaspora owczarzaki ATCC 30864]|uniref:Transaminase n=1 Tax=Capsaspora owczarzaki (strain ATCC 30864) TaxID=595528 RepID=A0A0D2VI15_CAPO3|nr:transaminase [Capsaspora owczarzaki ATCC 30864]KJE89572.1 transaminase [Capsaspora owczarzaki ATCC 30864]|eukprot:XP_004365886.2 transaminase [Capsaspora owczarzaki ATCC 30864]
MTTLFAAATVAVRSSGLSLSSLSLSSLSVLPRLSSSSSSSKISPFASMSTSPSNPASAAPPPLVFSPAQRVSGFGDSVFAEFTALAIAHSAVNLGQGFPDFAAPDFVKQAGAKHIVESNLNQYVRSMGHVKLVNTLARHYAPADRHNNPSINPMTDIVVTAGATEGMFATFQAILNPGDEVILMEPFYDAYPAQITMAGGVPRYVPLRLKAAEARNGTSDDWYLDLAEFRAAFTSKTKAIVLNNPHNPLGKVFRRDELEAIAQVVCEKNVIAISDEVYEHLVFNDAPNRHIPLSTLPGMLERTIKLGSAGKTFSVTGWKVGWVVAPAPIARAIFLAHQWIPFCVAAPFQEAVADALEHADKSGFFDEFQVALCKKRDRLMDGLKQGGLPGILPHGGYFVLADTSSIWPKLQRDLQSGDANPSQPHDYTVCKQLTKSVGVVPIPPSSFFTPQHQPSVKDLARFAFCKEDRVIDEACRRLQAFGAKK